MCSIIGRSRPGEWRSPRSVDMFRHTLGAAQHGSIARSTWRRSQSINSLIVECLLCYHLPYSSIRSTMASMWIWVVSRSGTSRSPPLMISGSSVHPKTRASAFMSDIIRRAICSKRCFSSVRTMPSCRLGSMTPWMACCSSGVHYNVTGCLLCFRPRYRGS